MSTARSASNPEPTSSGSIAHDAAARRLVDLKEAAHAADHASGDAARADQLTRQHIEASLHAHQEHDLAAEAFRRTYYPAAGRACASFGEVFVVSRGGRNVRTVWSAEKASA